MDVGEVYKVRSGYTCFVGCNIYDSGKVVEVTDSNKAILESQKHKLENHLTNKITEEKPKRKRNSDKMVRTVRSK